MFTMKGSSIVSLIGAFLVAIGTETVRGELRFQQELQKLTALDAAYWQHYGIAVSISEDHVIVGAQGDDDAANGAGAVYVLRRSDNGTPLDPSDDFWVDEDKLTVSDAAELDRFGVSVALDGDRFIGAAIYNDDAGPVTGSAYVFRRSDNDTPLDPSDDFWIEEDKLTASDAAAGDWFGVSVSISGDWAVVGASHDNDAGEHSGSAYMFRHDDNGTPSDPTDDLWVEMTKLAVSDASEIGFFGWSVSISGDRCIVGAIWGEAAYVFRRSDNGTPSDSSDDFWVEEAKLVSPDPVPFEVFGYSVSLSGDKALVGAFGLDDGGVDAGKAYVFRRSDNGTPSDPSDDFWVEEDKLTASDGVALDRFGKFLSISGDLAVVGAEYDDDVCPEDVYCNSGAAYVFRRNDNATPSDPSDDFWVEVAKLTATDADVRDFFGHGVSISSDRVVVGAYRNDDAGANTGSAYVFAVSGDCNGNGVSDDQDIAGGVSEDTNANGIPDECEPSQPLLSPSPHDARKNRYVSFVPNSEAFSVALRVEMIAGPGIAGVVGWVGEPEEIAPDDFVSRVVDAPLFRDWPESVIHLGDCEIVPVATYEIRSTLNGFALSNPLDVSTIAEPTPTKWGDCVGEFVAGAWTEPNGVVNFNDIQAGVRAFQVDPAAPHVTWMDLDNEVPNKIINFADIQRIVEGFLGQAYPFSDPANCP